MVPTTRLDIPTSTLSTISIFPITHITVPVQSTFTLQKLEKVQNHVVIPTPDVLTITKVAFFSHTQNLGSHRLGQVDLWTYVQTVWVSVTYEPMLTYGDCRKQIGYGVSNLSNSFDLWFLYMYLGVSRFNNLCFIINNPTTDPTISKRTVSKPTYSPSVVSNSSSVTCDSDDYRGDGNTPDPVVSVTPPVSVCVSDSVRFKTHEETDSIPHSVIYRPVGSTKHALRELQHISFIITDKTWGKGNT